MFMFDKLKRYLIRYLAAPIRFMDNADFLTALIDVVIFVVVAVVIDVYVIGSQALFNTSSASPGYAITSVVVPILQTVILIGCIVTAILVLRAITKSQSK
jgi:hypothetical protein